MAQIVNALLLRDGKLLVARRSAHRRSYPDCWSFPGGHIEPGETLEAALIREMHEEIGLVPVAFRAIAVIDESDPRTGEDVTYHFFTVSAWDGGEPTICDREHSELRWVSLERAGGLEPLALPGYQAIFSQLRSGQATNKNGAPGA